MKKTRMFFAVAVLAGLLAAPALAATQLVGASQSAPFDNLDTAITWANANPGADTLELTDAAYTINGDPAAPAPYPTTTTVVSETLTITYAAGNTGTITLSKTAGAGQGIRFTNATNNTADPMGGTLSIIGFSEAAPIIMENVAANTPVINCGAVISGTHNWVLENVVLRRPTSGTGSVSNFFVMNNSAVSPGHTMTNVKFVGGDPAGAANGIVAESQTAGNYNNLTMVNCDFSQMTVNGAVFSHGNTRLVANDCNFTMTGNIAIVAQAGTAPFNANAGMELTDCSFRSGDARAFTLGIGSMPYVLTDPVFAGKCGDIAFAAEASPMEFTIRGTDPANKVDFNPMATGGTVLVARTRGGTWTFENCTDSTGFPAGLIDCATGQNLLADVNIIQDQCAWLDGRSGDFIGADTGGAFSTNFTATNTIWAGNTPAGHLLAAIGSHTGQSLISLTHCTVAKNTANAMFFGNAGDTVELNGCIIYTTEITASHALSSIAVSAGIPNLVFVDDADDGTGSPYQGAAFLPAAIVADPLLDLATGKISNPNSPALGGALGSAVPVDFEGDARPLGGGIPDMGADESAVFGVNDILNPDTDGDGMPDPWEIANGLDPFSAIGENGAYGDPDGDGWTNLEEYQRGTDPNYPDPRPVPVGGLALVGMALALAVAGVVARKRG